MSPIVIMGAGHAGITLVRQIRMKDKYIPIIMISQDAVYHYYKPSLSKALSLGKSPDELIMSSMAQLTEDLNVKIFDHTQVTGVFPNKQKIIIQRKDESPEILPYQSLVFAIGAKAINLAFKGNSQDSIYSVNNLTDYRNFRQKIHNKKRVLIVGAGFVGCEFASDLSLAGIHVDIIDRGLWPLQKSLPKPLGNAIEQSMAKENVNWHFNNQVLSVYKKIIGPDKSALEVTLKNGEVLETDAILSAVGIKPCTALAEKCGIHTDKGIVVNNFAQTNLANIYALGDCVEYQNTLLPFIQPATNMAKSLANTLLAKPCVLKITSLAVPVKIPTCPTIICPPVCQDGNWHVTGNGMDLQARFINTQGETLGFALTGKATSHKHALIQECLAPFSEHNNGLMNEGHNSTQTSCALSP